MSLLVSKMSTMWTFPTLSSLGNFNRTCSTAGPSPPVLHRCRSFLSKSKAGSKTDSDLHNSSPPLKVPCNSRVQTVQTVNLEILSLPQVASLNFMSLSMSGVAACRCKPPLRSRCAASIFFLPAMTRRTNSGLQLGSSHPFATCSFLMPARYPSIEEAFRPLLYASQCTNLSRVSLFTGNSQEIFFSAKNFLSILSADL